MKSAEKFIIIYFLLPGVLCREFSISLPESVEGVRGLCVVIPCRFEIKEQYDKDLQGVPAGIWFKDGTDPNSDKVFNSGDPTDNKIKGEIIGDLLMKNCTTIFYNITERHSGDYYFRIEASGLKNTYRSSSVSVRVKDSPITPSITLYKEDQEKLEDQKQVLEGTSVRIMCSAPSPPCLLKPPTFTWNFLPEEGRQEQNHNSSFSSSQLNFKASHLHHGRDFTCNVTFQIQNITKSAQSSFLLHVLYAPQILPFSICTTTVDSFNCSCEVHGNPSPILEWSLSGKSASPSEVISTSARSANSTTSTSFISIRKPVSEPLRCVGFNKLGVTSQVFSFIKESQCSSAKGSGVDYVSVLIGAAGGMSVMMMMCVLSLFVRKTGNKPVTGQKETSGMIVNDETVPRKDDEECVYENKVVLSNSLLYSTVMFPNENGSSEIIGLSSLTSEYATVHHDSQHQPEGRGPEKGQRETRITENNVQEDEVTYGNITHQLTVEQTLLDLSDDYRDDDKTK